MKSKAGGQESECGPRRTTCLEFCRKQETVSVKDTSILPDHRPKEIDLCSRIGASTASVAQQRGNGDVPPLAPPARHDERTGLWGSRTLSHSYMSASSILLQLVVYCIIPYPDVSKYPPVRPRWWWTLSASSGYQRVWVKTA